MVAHHPHLLTEQECADLLSYARIKDHRMDVRPDVITKHPRWNQDQWPQHHCERVLDRVLPYDYEVEEVLFNDSQIAFRLHADSGHSDRDRRGHTVLMPLWMDGAASTVFFDAHWHGDATKFSRRKILPWEYQLKNRWGEWQRVPDVRRLLTQIDHTPHEITDFVITDQFRDDVATCVKARSNQLIGTADDRCYDYAEVEGYDATLPCDLTAHSEWMTHLEPETIQGLRIHSVAEWSVGDVWVFERTRLHCASHHHRRKIGLSVFVRPQQ